MAQIICVHRLNITIQTSPSTLKLTQHYMSMSIKNSVYHPDQEMSHHLQLQILLYLGSSWSLPSYYVLPLNLRFALVCSFQKFYHTVCITLFLGFFFCCCCLTCFCKICKCFLHTAAMRLSSQLLFMLRDTLLHGYTTIYPFHFHGHLSIYSLELL